MKDGLKQDFTKLLKKEHAGKWVAFPADYSRVVAYSDDLVGLEKQVGREGIVFMKAHEADITYAFFKK